MYHACMANVQVRDVPDDVHEALRRRAAANGQSLNEYLRTELAQLAARPSIAEMAARLRERGPATTGSSAQLIRALRDER